MGFLESVVSNAWACVITALMTSVITEGVSKPAEQRVKGGVAGHLCFYAKRDILWSLNAEEGKGVGVQTVVADRHTETKGKLLTKEGVTQRRRQ